MIVFCLGSFGKALMRKMYRKNMLSFASHHDWNGTYLFHHQFLLISYRFQYQKCKEHIIQKLSIRIMRFVWIWWIFNDRLNRSRSNKYVESFFSTYKNIYHIPIIPIQINLWICQIQSEQFLYPNCNIRIKSINTNIESNKNSNKLTRQ